jgi:CheY-like chemotaxis protein
MTQESTSNSSHSPAGLSGGLETGSQDHSAPQDHAGSRPHDATRLASESGAGSGSSEAADNQQLQEEKRSSPLAPEEAPARVLFVDDEESIVKLALQVLGRMGYSVTALANAAEAVESFETKPDLYDVVITDLTMPRVGGLELARRVSLRRPGTPVILTTGFGELFPFGGALDHGIREVIQKPYSFRALALAIRRILDSERESPDESPAPPKKRAAKQGGD